MWSHNIQEPPNSAGTLGDARRRRMRRPSSCSLSVCDRRQGLEEPWHVSALTPLLWLVCSTPGIISTFLHVHPFGASIEYICSYLQRLDTKVTGRHHSELRCGVDEPGQAVCVYMRHCVHVLCAAKSSEISGDLKTSQAEALNASRCSKGNQRWH